MGCNNSQDLNAQKYTNDDSERANDKNESEQNASVTEYCNNLPSADESCVEKNVKLSPAKPKSENQCVQEVTNDCSHQQGSIPREDISTNKAQNNDLEKSDNNIENCNLKICTKATINELNIIDTNEFENSENDNAAIKIQALYRGHKVRANMKKSADTSVSAAATSQKTTIDANSKEAVASATIENIDPTKEELEAEFDPNDKELCDAALKIQATFRGHLSRKLAGNKDADDVDIQEITKKVAEELDIDLTDPELNKAATKIQASFRGHKSRKDAN